MNQLSEIKGKVNTQKIHSTIDQANANLQRKVHSIENKLEKKANQNSEHKMLMEERDNQMYQMGQQKNTSIQNILNRASSIENRKKQLHEDKLEKKRLQLDSVLGKFAYRDSVMKDQNIQALEDKIQSRVQHANVILDQKTENYAHQLQQKEEQNQRQQRLNKEQNRDIQDIRSQKKVVQGLQMQAHTKFEHYQKKVKEDQIERKNVQASNFTQKRNQEARNIALYKHEIDLEKEKIKQAML